MKTKVKTIDIQAKEWFDKINGNSYFAGIVTVNFGLPTVKTFTMPFQYGYGSQYQQEAGNILHMEGITKQFKYESGGLESLWSYCEKNGIILRSNIAKNCKKSELKQY